MRLMHEMPYGVVAFVQLGLRYMTSLMIPTTDSSTPLASVVKGWMKTLACPEGKSVHIQKQEPLERLFSR